MRRALPLVVVVVVLCVTCACGDDPPAIIHPDAPYAYWCGGDTIVYDRRCPGDNNTGDSDD